MIVYSNGLNIQMNEIAILQFMQNTQSGNGPVASLAVQYDILKQMHKAIGDCLEQYDAKVHQLNRDKLKQN